MDHVHSSSSPDRLEADDLSGGENSSAGGVPARKGFVEPVAVVYKQ